MWGKRTDISPKHSAHISVTASSLSTCMDPLSVIASVVGILGAAAKISGSITELTKRSKHAPQGISQLQKEVETIRVTLEQLRGFILRKQAVNQTRAGWILVEQIVVVLAGCVTTFSDLEVFMD